MKYFSNITLLYNIIKNIIGDKFQSFSNNDIDYSKLKEYMTSPPFLEVPDPIKLKQDIENEKEKKKKMDEESKDKSDEESKDKSHEESKDKSHEESKDKSHEELKNEPHYYKILKKLNNKCSIYLFHSYWMKLWESLQLPYKKFFKLCEEIRQKRKELANHIKKGPNKSFKPGGLSFGKKKTIFLIVFKMRVLTKCMKKK